MLHVAATLPRHQQAVCVPFFMRPLCCVVFQFQLGPYCSRNYWASPIAQQNWPTVGHKKSVDIQIEIAPTSNLNCTKFKFKLTINSNLNSHHSGSHRSSQIHINMPPHINRYRGHIITDSQIHLNICQHSNYQLHKKFGTPQARTCIRSYIKSSVHRTCIGSQNCPGQRSCISSNKTMHPPIHKLTLQEDNLPKCIHHQKKHPTASVRQPVTQDNLTVLLDILESWTSKS